MFISRETLQLAIFWHLVAYQWYVEILCSASQRVTHIYKVIIKQIKLITTKKRNLN